MNPLRIVLFILAGIFIIIGISFINASGDIVTVTAEWCFIIDPPGSECMSQIGSFRCYCYRFGFYVNGIDRNIRIFFADIEQAIEFWKNHNYKNGSQVDVARYNDWTYGFITDEMINSWFVGMTCIGLATMLIILSWCMKRDYYHHRTDIMDA